MERARLEIVDGSGAVTVAAPYEIGDAMLDVCDEARAGVPFGCRSATCGSCMVEVVEGDEALEPPSALEAAALREHGLSATERLACRAIFAAPRLVRVRVRGLAPR